MQKHEWKNNPVKCLKNKRIGKFNKIASKLMWKPEVTLEIKGHNQSVDPVVETISYQERTFLGKIVHFLFGKKFKKAKRIVVK